MSSRLSCRWATMLRSSWPRVVVAVHTRPWARSRCPTCTAGRPGRHWSARARRARRPRWPAARRTRRPGRRRRAPAPAVRAQPPGQRRVVVPTEHPGDDEHPRPARAQREPHLGVPQDRMRGLLTAPSGWWPGGRPVPPTSWAAAGPQRPRGARPAAQGPRCTDHPVGELGVGQPKSPSTTATGRGSAASTQAFQQRAVPGAGRRPALPHGVRGPREGAHEGSSVRRARSASRKTCAAGRTASAGCRPRRWPSRGGAPCSGPAAVRPSEHAAPSSSAPSASTTQATPTSPISRRQAAPRAPARSNGCAASTTSTSPATTCSPPQR